MSNASNLEEESWKSCGKDVYLKYLCDGEKVMCLTETLRQCGVILGPCLKKTPTTYRIILNSDNGDFSSFRLVLHLGK